MFNLYKALNTILVFVSLLPELRAFSASDYQIAYQTASEVYSVFCNKFVDCVNRANDNAMNFEQVPNLNFPMKTTVGFVPNYTTNRKFFANMISTVYFKEMLAEDETICWKNMIKKAKYCDEAVMDQNMLKELYDREIETSKLKK